MRAPRNPLAVAARGRNGGPMKDRRASRGGQRNDARDILDEHADELDDLHEDIEFARLLNYVKP